VFQLLLGLVGTMTLVGAMQAAAWLGPRFGIAFAAQAVVLLAAAADEWAREELLVAFAGAGLVVTGIGTFRPSRSAVRAPVPRPPLAVPRERIDARSGFDVSGDRIGCFYTFPLLPPFSMLAGGLPAGRREPRGGWRERWQAVRGLRIESPIVRVPPQFMGAAGTWAMGPDKAWLEGVLTASSIDPRNIREMDADWRTRSGVTGPWFVGGDDEFLGWFDRHGRSESGRVVVEDAAPRAVAAQLWELLTPRALRSTAEVALGLVLLAAVAGSPVRSSAAAVRDWLLSRMDALILLVAAALAVAALLRGRVARFLAYASLAGVILLLNRLTDSDLSFLGL
jgi:hypothetical protein